MIETERPGEVRWKRWVATGARRATSASAGGLQPPRLLPSLSAGRRPLPSGRDLAGACILPRPEQRAAVQGALFEVTWPAPAGYAHLVGQIVPLRWTDDPLAITALSR